MPPANAITKLCKAHIEFETNVLSQEGLVEFTQTEISALFEWFKTICLNDLTSARETIAFFERNVIEFPITEQTPAFIGKCADKIHHCLQNDDTRLKEILPKPIYDEIAGDMFAMDALRNEIINQAVNSTIFSMLITETLYGGIKAFVLSENIIMKNVPGASSLFALGKGLLNKTTFGLSNNIANHLDEQIKIFVKSNIKSHLKNSEKFLVEAFDPDLIQQSCDEIWQKAQKYDAQAVAKLVDQEHIESLAPVIRDFWLNFRNTPVFKEISSSVIEYFFEIYGNRKIDDLLLEMGITAKIVIDEVKKGILPILGKPIIRDYLEQRIRLRLERFYHSR